TKTITIESKMKTKYPRIEIPEVPRHLYPLVATVVLQLMAYYLGVARNLPVDTPPSLAKTITT
ncbi:MAG: hypothetical protein QXF04_03905, partial [Candidatus Aenigmatarchaeota archaeon]